MNEYEKALYELSSISEELVSKYRNEFEILQELVDKFNNLPSKEEVIDTINYLLQEATYKNHNKILKLKDNLVLLTNLINTIYGDTNE